MNIKSGNECRGWTQDEMRDFFWENLAQYKKEPTQQALANMEHVFNWATHMNYGIVGNLREGLKWCGIEDFYTEAVKQGWEEE